MNNLILVDIKTGEKLELTNDKKSLELFLAGLDNTQKGIFLTKANFLKRVTATIEKILKDFIKSEKIEFDEEGNAFWENWKLKQMTRSTFDRKLFEETASAKEKALVEKSEEVQRKYQNQTDYLTFL